jgi:TetR/AcrR family transcriptional regulator, transcriptional repressor for nem operon
MTFAAFVVRSILLTDRFQTRYCEYMGRPREFQEQEVVADALQIFWRQGYRATSIPDLLSATGLERGSLYKAFQDKQSLFNRAFNAYLESGRAAIRKTLSAPGTPLERLTAWLDQASRGCSGTFGGPGCLAVNAMVELAPFEPAVRSRLARHWAIVEGTLARTLSEGQREHEIRSDLPAKELAQMVVRIFAGMATFSRQGNCTDVFRTVLYLLRSKP